MAKSFNLTAKINAQLGNVRPVVQSLKRQLSGIKANVNININPNTARNVAQLSRNLATLNITLGQTTQAARSATSALNALNSAAGSAKIAQLAKQASQVNKALGNTTKQAKSAANQMEEFGRVSGLAIRRFAGFSVATGVVFGLVNAIGGAIGKAIEFDQQLVRIAQATKSTKEGMRSLSAEITRLSTGLGVSSAELVEVSLILAQAGLSARDTKTALEALAKSSLAPTFTDIKNTVEGSIAAIAQFEIGVKDLESVLGSINAVSAAFAVESDDIIAAVRRTGGVFAAASQGVSQGKDALNEFIAVFTSIRATTRESAETIATGLRTIFTRFQRADTIRNLEELGIKLTDAEGKFIGAYKAVDALAAGLKDLDPRDLRFSEIVEELGGFRQVSKVIPLIAQTEKRLKALSVAQQGQNSLDADAAKGQEAFAVRLAKTREEFLALVREMSETDSFKAILDITLRLADGLIDLARTFKPLLPIFATLGALKLGSIATSFTSGFFKGARGRNEGGYAPKFHGGGLVPGGRGVKDDYPATLQTGEYVIRRKAVDKLGRGTLDKLNRQGYAAGGIVNQDRIGAAILLPEGDYGTASITVGPEDTQALKSKKTYQYVRQGLPESVSEQIQNTIGNGLSAAIDKGAAQLGGPGFANQVSAKNLLSQINVGNLEGNIFEGMLSLANSKNGAFDSALDPNRSFDFTDGFDDVLAKNFNLLSGIKYIDAKRSKDAALPKGLEDKLINQLNSEAGFSKIIRKDDSSKKKPGGRKPSEENLAAAAAKKAAAKAAFQSRLGRANGGEVPAILTRGEYVLNKKAADSIGPEMLDRLNNADRIQRYHTGGPVGLAGGGTVPSNATANVVAAGLSGNKFSTRQLDVVIDTFQKAGISGKELDRATRAWAKSIINGKSATEALVAGQNAAAKAAKAQAAAAQKAASNSSLGGIGFNPFTKAGRTGISQNSGIIKGLKNSAAGIKSNPLAALGGIAIAGQAIGNQFDAKGTNSVVQGTTGLIGGAAAGAAFGGPVGAVLGGAFGAASGIANADIAKANEEANEALKKSTQEVDKAFRDFAKSGSLKSIESAFANANAANVQKASSTLKESAGVSGFLGGLVGFSNEESLAISSNFAGSIAAGFGSESAIKELDKSDRRRRIGRFDQLAVENQPNAEIAKQFFEKQITAGKSVEDILSTKAGKNAAQAFAISNTTDEQGKLALQSSIERVATANESGDEKEIAEARKQLDREVAASARALISEQKAEVDLRNKLNTAVAQSSRELDMFYNRLDELSAAFSRANETMAVGQQNLSLISDELSGNVSVKSRKNKNNLNVFGNLEAFSEGEVTTAAGRLNQRLGGGAAATELTQNIIAAKKAKDVIPSILEGAAAQGGLGTEGQNSFITSRIKARLTEDGASETVINKLIAQVNQTLNSRKDGDPLDLDTLNTDLGDVFNKVSKVGEEATKSLDDAFEQYQNAVTQNASLQLAANKALDKASNIRAEGNLKVRELRDENISLADLTKPFEDSIKSLTGGKTDVRSISANISSLQLQKTSALKSAASTTDTGLAQQFTVSAGAMEIALQENREALETLSNDTTILSEVQRKLADLETKRQQAEKSLEDLAFGSTEDKNEFGRRAGLANRLLGGEQLRGPDLKAALDTIKELGNVLNAGGLISDDKRKDIDKFGQEAVLNDPFIKALFGGVDPGLNRIGGAIRQEGGERENLIGTAEEALKRQADAADALAKLQNNTNVYLQELNKSLNAATITIQQSLASLNGRVPQVNTGLPVRRNNGGFIPGGGPNRDTVPAMLTTGEYVVNRDAAQRNGALLEQINNGERLPFNNGGSVTREKAIQAAIARKQRLGRSTYYSQLALAATINATGGNAPGVPGNQPATPADERIAVRAAIMKEKENRIKARDARYEARRNANPLRYTPMSRGRSTPSAGVPGTGRALGNTATTKATISDIKDLARRAAIGQDISADVRRLSPSERRLGSSYYQDAVRARAAQRITPPPASRLTREIAERAARGVRPNDVDKAYISRLTVEERQQGSALFKQYRARRSQGFNSGGSVGGKRSGGSGGGGSTFSTSVGEFGKYAQAFATSAAQFERAAGIISKINIPNKIEMTGTHTVQVIINGADVLSKMEGPMRDLVTSEIQKAMGRHINPITGETSGEFNG